MSFIDWVENVAAGLTAYRDSRDFDRPDELDDEESWEPTNDRLSVANPFVRPDQAMDMEKNVLAIIAAFYLQADYSSSAAFLSIRKLAHSVILAVKDDNMSEPLAARAYLFELARVAHSHFSHDTTADRMWIPEDGFQHRSAAGVTVPLYTEGRVFLEAAFDGRLEDAVKVHGMWVAKVAPICPPESAASPEFMASLIMIALILVDLSGTYGAQVNPTRMSTTEHRPIQATILEAEDD